MSNERMMDNRNWGIFKNKKGWPVWWQHFYEAFLVVTKRHSLHKAWQRGVEQGTHNEYRRLITNQAYKCEVATRQPTQDKGE